MLKIDIYEKLNAGNIRDKIGWSEQPQKDLPALVMLLCSEITRLEERIKTLEELTKNDL